MYRGKKVEGAVKLLGARTVGESRASDSVRYMKQQKRIMQEQYDVLANKLFNAKDFNEAVRIYDKMKELKGVQTQDEIKDMNNGIMQRAKSAQLTEEARVFLTMPKKIKKEKIIRR